MRRALDLYLDPQRPDFLKNKKLSNVDVQTMLFLELSKADAEVRALPHKVAMVGGILEMLSLYPH